MKRKTLMHYTSLESAINILKTKRMKFTNLKDMDDLQEANLSLYYPRLCSFASCSFSKTNKENIPMWKIYGNNNCDGAVIKFVFKPDCDYSDLFYDKGIIGCEINYVKVNQFNKYAKGYSISGLQEGFAKSSCWAFENEYRFGIFDWQDMQFADINFECISKIKVNIFPRNNSDINTGNIKKNQLKEIKNSQIYEKTSFSKSNYAKIIKEKK